MKKIFNSKFIRFSNASKKTLAAIVFLIFTSIAFSQTLDIQGTVLDKDSGQPLPGVTIIVKDTSTGTTTDFDGFYSIKASLGAVLMFTYVGMEDVELIVSESVHNILMNENLTGLDEIVVVG